MTQERALKPIAQSANTSMIGMSNLGSDAPMNPADYISEDFLQVLEVSPLVRSFSVHMLTIIRP